MDFLENIYISPLELCNLACKVCYTNKTKHILTNDQILKFVDNYSAHLKLMSSLVKGRIKERFRLKSITFCGGEVFTLPDFSTLVNTLQQLGIFISIITNGTIDKLDQIHDPRNCQLLVSFDGPKAIHDANRGHGNFKKSLDFIKHAQKLGFPVEIMFLVTPDSYPYIDSFHRHSGLDPESIKLNYITVKTKFFTDKHPLATNTNSQGLTRDQIINIKRNYSSIPAKNFGCVQLSLQSNGYIYGCCETAKPLGTMTDDPQVYIDKLQKALGPCHTCRQCLGCCDQDFLCGYKKELAVTTCQEVVKLCN